MSLRTSCSCRLIVLVETTVRSRLRTAQRAAGTRYAIDLPVPVPASTSPVPPSLKHSATKRSIARWPARSS